MKYLRHIYIKILLVVYLKGKFKWIYYILSNSPVSGTCFSQVAWEDLWDDSCRLQRHWHRSHEVLTHRTPLWAQSSLALECGMGLSQSHAASVSSLAHLGFRSQLLGPGFPLSTQINLHCSHQWTLTFCL